MGEGGREYWISDKAHRHSLKVSGGYSQTFIGGAFFTKKVELNKRISTFIALVVFARTQSYLEQF